MDSIPKGSMGGEGFEGVVTVSQWTRAPDGETYLYFWARKWVIVTDKLIGKMIGATEFRSSEKWSLLGYGAATDPVVFFPGCQVKGWMRSNGPPETRPTTSAVCVIS